jgi:hypothetical protein
MDAVEISTKPRRDETPVWSGAEGKGAGLFTAGTSAKTCEPRHLNSTRSQLPHEMTPGLSWAAGETAFSESSTASMPQTPANATSKEPNVANHFTTSSSPDVRS